QLVEAIRDREHAAANRVSEQIVEDGGPDAEGWSTNAADQWVQGRLWEAIDLRPGSIAGGERGGGAHELTGIRCARYGAERKGRGGKEGKCEGVVMKEDPGVRAQTPDPSSQPGRYALGRLDDGECTCTGVEHEPRAARKQRQAGDGQPRSGRNGALQQG